MVRAKFVCTGVKKYCHWDKAKGFLYEAQLSAVTSGSKENEMFFAATPAGEVKIATMTADHFEPGKAYYLDFIEAE